ncbi:MAG: TetR/AcrR family transcriptional regulator [Pseudomonadota bacterium]
MPPTTRDQLLAAATALFAERGFYGVSIAHIANEVGLTKQALLHHFSTKEKLYGDVLETISGDLDDLRADALSISSDPTAQLQTFLRAMARRDRASTIRSRLLMRELLDNKRRADTAGVWYLKPFLENLVLMMQRLPAWKGVSDSVALAAVYQLLGAINYYAVSEPTLSGILGGQRYGELDRAFGGQLDRTIAQVLTRSSE